MFKTVTRTWNPFTGCLFECTYCWARALVLGKLARSPKYKDGFTPTFHPHELKRRFKPDEFVFISDMGDIYWVSLRSDLYSILEVVEAHPQTKFLFQTKAPEMYLHWHLRPFDNLYLGTTIETNRDYGVSKAPPPMRRFYAMCLVDHPLKFLSIEPVMDFSLDVMTRWVEEMHPDIIEVGADNYGNNLLEPPPDKLAALLERLDQICPRVERKEGLERLLK
jgi:DNA repair photolyase